MLYSVCLALEAIYKFGFRRNPRLVNSLLILGVATLATVSCQNRSTTAQARFYHNGAQKPTIAVVPVFDHTTPTVEWDLSEELTQGISERLVKKDKLFLTEQQKVRSFIKDLQHAQNPFTLDLAWVKPTFVDQDFVVFMELLQHEQKAVKRSPDEDPRMCGAELNIALRVRVLDLRAENPKIVLQEIMHHNQVIPRQLTQFNYLQEAWGEHDYSISTLGLAHAQLTKKVAGRIEEYILLARGNL